MTEEKTCDEATIDRGPIIMEPRAALEFLGEVTRGRSLLEVHVAATTIKVKKPTKDAVTFEQPENETPAGGP